MIRAARRMLTGVTTPAQPASSLTFPAPTNADFPDNPVSLGTVFRPTINGIWIGNRIRISTTLPGATLVAFAGGIQSKSFTGVAGTTMDVLFDTPIGVDPNHDWTAGYFTDRYAFTTNPYPLTSPDGKIVASGGLFKYDPGPVNPDQTTTLFFQVGPLVVFP